MALVTSVTPTERALQQPGGRAHPPREHGTSSPFRQLLSELNPLQYLPVVGTIYRAITGDVIPEQARFVGSLVVSGLTGGPAGVAMNLGSALLERLTGIDPEKVASRLLASIGVGGQQAAPAAVPQPVALAAAAPRQSAWSQAQRQAYATAQSPQGVNIPGGVSGADFLNGLELARLAGTQGRLALSTVA